MTKLKKCSKCEKSKRKSSFYTDPGKKDGLYSSCKVCHNKTTMKFYWNNEKRMKVVNRRNANKAYRKWRLAAMTTLCNGVPKCTRCGCNYYGILEFNHINGGGSKEHKQNHFNISFFKSILTGREDVNILCRVCNALDYLERKFGNLPFSIKWTGESIYAKQ